MSQNDKYKCPNCDKVFKTSKGLNYHTSHNSCKESFYRCKYCDKGFTSTNSMYRHMRDNCGIKKQDDEQKNEIYERLLKLEEENNKMKEKHKKEIDKLKKQIDKTKVSQSVNNIDNRTVKNTNNGNIVNGDVNNNINIILVGYGQEDISKIDKSDIIKAIQSGYHSTIKLTETLHFNPKYPEYHNIYISNMKDKYAMMFDGSDWILTIKEDLITKIYEDKKNYIEENLETFIESLTVSRKKSLERWLETEDADAKITDIKDQIKMLLYNKRKMPLKTAELVKDSEEKSDKKVVVKKKVCNPIK